MSDWSGRKLHFIGIGGAGMSGLAVVCAELGATVTGSDRNESSYMERVRGAGVEPTIGHDAANLPEGA
ncbi:MAG TPA: Mur ligase domain-containing protein, partial [Solirubrobacterales bacterium]|nr:Mur ligase domain-containing protein [Solirubrobacterales bacterium]